MSRIEIVKYPTHYRRPGEGGPAATDQKCLDCGAGEDELCWDLRMPIGERRAVKPHPIRRIPIDRRRIRVPEPDQSRFTGGKLRYESRGVHPLSEVDRGFLVMIAEGLTNEAIRRRTGRSLEGVKARVRMLLWKMGATCRANAVHLAYQRGILQAPAQPPSVTRSPEPASA